MTTTITWQNTGNLNFSQLKAAEIDLNYNAQYINSVLARPIDWNIKINIDDTVPTMNGSSNSTFYYNIGTKNVFASLGEYKTITGNKDYYDLNNKIGYTSIINSNSVYFTKYFVDTTPENSSDVPTNITDTLSVLLHEMTHGLCFTGWADWKTGAVNNTLSPFDLHIIMKNGNPYFNGANVQRVYGGDVPLSPGNLFHVGNSTDGAILASDVMEGFTGWTPGRKYYSDLDLAIFADCGIGTIKNDILNGTSGNDNIMAGAGNDLINASTGDDLIDGGSGIDTLTYTTKSNNFSISSTNSGLYIHDKVGAFGDDNLISIENLNFSDLTFDTSMFTKTAALSSSQIINLVELYIASFNRAPDSVGLDYWGSRLSDGMSLEQIAKSFFVQPETVSAYPTTMAASDFVSKVYNNVLSRGPDKNGLDYWVTELNNGHVTKDSFLLAIINGAMAPTGSAVDRQTLANKEAVGENYAIYNGLNNSTNWSKDVMSGVNDQISSVSLAIAKNNAYTSIASNSISSDLTVKIGDNIISYNSASSWIGANGNKYIFYTNPLSWSDANLFALKIGGHLAKIDTTDENTEIFNNIYSCLGKSHDPLSTANDGGGSSYVWLGGTANLTTKSWSWSYDNTPIDTKSPLWGTGKLQWSGRISTSEPDYSVVGGQTQNSLALGIENWPYGYSNGNGAGDAGHWNDILGSDKLYYVVEIEKSSRPTPASPTTQVMNSTTLDLDTVISQKSPSWLILGEGDQFENIIADKTKTDDYSNVFTTPTTIDAIVKLVGVAI